MCGAIQLTVDIIIVAQIWMYRENTDQNKVKQHD
jgi:hypothetical protein